MSNPVPMIVTATPDPDQAEAFATYSSMGPPQLVASGGVPKLREKLVERLAGDRPSNMVFAAEFDSLDAAKAEFETEACKAALPFRDNAFNQLDIMLKETLR